ncbi:heterokaryon incompatibility protein-domain-containing protein [Colletotrichum cereale]|nr:heterokaryon incompatibility protein-domain-containing protein [Colletotrichum cereale]
MYQSETWLCAICMQVVQPKGNGLTFRNGTPSGQNLETFRKAAADNCFICSKLWNLSGQHRRAWDSLVSVEWNPFHYVVDREDEYNDLFVFSNTQGYTGSSTTLDSACSWFHNCASRHNRCKNSPISTEGWLPSRLLDVGSHGDAHWKLLISATDVTESPTPAYLTLSYRWGTDPQHTVLSSSTIDQHRRGTKISDLPQTFQDLVLVARNFGIRYVWIDCFCIIQNCRDDWEAEAPMMRHIYANAACNIAASASDSPNGGLFRSRDVRDIQPGIVSTTLMSELPNKFYIFDKSYWNRELLAGSLHRRGWVFQERFLGPRQLYFAQNQVLWECLEEHKCEGFPHGIPLYDSFKSIDRLLSLVENTENPVKRQKKDHRGDIDNKMTFWAVDLWCDLVTAYSRCDFTYPQDKLYAFAGIIGLFQEVTGDKHLAGIWRSRILHFLNWTVFTPKPKHSARYRAPSWSWASIDGPVKMHKPAAGFKFLASVSDADTTTKKEGGDAAGVVAGFINLRGALIMASYTREPTDGPLQVQPTNRGMRSFSVWPYPDTAESRFESPGTMDFLILKSQKVHYEDPEQSAAGENIDLTCLILSPVSELGGIYKRIGWFSLRHKGAVSALLTVCKEELRNIVLV